MKSILQSEKECFICKTTAGLEEHHIFPGSRRRASEKWGCKVWLCNRHHTGADGVQWNARKSLKLKQLAQSKYEQLYGHEAFINAFGKNYLEVNKDAEQHNADW